MTEKEKMNGSPLCTQSISPPTFSRFNPVQIGEWLDDLLARNVVRTHEALAEYVGMSRTRIGQFLVLAELLALTAAAN